MLERFTFLRVRFTVRSSGAFQLRSYPGTVVRGAFGQALFHHYCIFSFPDPKQCQPTCSIADSCAYRYLFLSQPSAPVLPGMTEPPRPYVLLPKIERQDISAGDTFQIQLTLFGQAVGELQHIVQAFAESLPQGFGPRKLPQGRRVPCELVGVDIVGNLGSTLALTEIPAVPPQYSLAIEDGSQAEKVTLFFETPLRLKEQGKVATSFSSFPHFWRLLRRRIMELGMLYCGLQPEEIPPCGDGESIQLADSQLLFVPGEHYSSRQQQKNSHAGLMGSITLSGNLGPYLPYLRLGEITHVGSGCVSGLGKYRVVVEE